MSFDYNERDPDEEYDLDKMLRYEEAERIANQLDGHRPRECYCCKDILFFEHYVNINKGRSLEELIEIWESDAIELYCCSCMRNHPQFKSLNERHRKAIKKIRILFIISFF